MRNSPQGIMVDSINREQSKKELIRYLTKLITHNNIRIIDVLENLKHKLENDGKLTKNQLRLVMQFVANESWSCGEVDVLCDRFSFLTKKEKKVEQPTVTLEEYWVDKSVKLKNKEIINTR